MNIISPLNDFIKELCQPSVEDHLRRNLEDVRSGELFTSDSLAPKPLALGPLSVNVDLTVAIQIKQFDTSHQCRIITCLYSQTNWWLDNICEHRTDAIPPSQAPDEIPVFL